MSAVCPNCREQNRDGARFCSNCSAPLSRACPNCRTVVPVTARFCPQCAQALSGLPSGAVQGGHHFTGRLQSATVLSNRYVIARRLGQGGMGAVYLANDTRFANKQWAIKEMSEQIIADPAERQAALAAFQQEAQLLAALDHPNLPKVADAFSENGNQYLVMEFVAGQTLEKRLEDARGPLAEREVLGYVEQLCDVLEYLHTRQPAIIFRDLKPANIMVQPPARVKLIDFGIARHFKPGKSKDTQAMGTPGYAAPEQYGKGQSDARADIYALGATMHHMLTGRDPGQTPFKFPSVRTLNTHVSAQVEAAVMKAVEMEPSQRWQQVSALRSALSAKAPPPAPQPVPAVTATVVSPPPRATALPPLQNSNPPPVVVVPTSMLGGFKRGGWVWTLFVIVAAGALLTVGPGLLYSFGWYGPWGMVVIPVLSLLAYLLTHRPGVILAIGLVGIFTGGAYISLIVWLASLLANEVILALSGWRTRNWFALWFAGLAGLAAQTLLLGGFYYDFLSIFYLFLGIGVALLVSRIINSVTGIGR